MTSASATALRARQPVTVPVRRKSARRFRGTLTMLATLMLVSALVRFGIGVSEALTTQPAPPVPIDVAESAPPDPGPLLVALQSREARLFEQEAALASRLQALALAEQELDRQITALEDAEARLSATLAFADQAAERDIARLTEIYEAMKPADAAALFQEMDPRFGAGFLARMRPEAAAVVMAGLTPELAYSVSVILAGRHAAVPTQ